MPSNDGTNSLPAAMSSSRPGRLRAGRTAATLAAIVVSVAALGTAAAPAQADDCPNAALRALNDSSGLPDCRAYEMVTNPYKQGFNAIGPTYGDDGAVAYVSVGNFVGNPYGVSLFNQYVARRSETGWKTISMNPPGEQWVFGIDNGASGMSRDFRSSLWWMRPRSAPSERWFDLSRPGALYLRRPDGVFSEIAPNPDTTAPRLFYSTPDLSHMVVGADSGRAPNLYEVTGGDQVLRPIGVDNTGAPLSDASGLCSHGLSEDGRVIFFGVGPQTNSCHMPLRARVGGTTTIEMAASQCTRDAGDPGGSCSADANVNLAGFASDGSRAMFTTTQQLVNSDIDSSNDLYACDIPAGAIAPTLPVNVCPELRRVSAGAVGGADVEGVIHVSADGSRAYFIASGVLAANDGANDQAAVAGAHNLYMWQTDAEHPEGQTTFMARLAELEPWTGVNARSTPDNRYLLIPTSTPLVASGVAADTDSAGDVYRYDTQTGEWRRLSTDTTGGGGSAEVDAISWDGEMTDDGRIVVFETDEALSPADTNTIGDVYAWHEGQVSLISPDGGENGGVTSSGNDIFFMTTSRVTAADADTSKDVYTARIGGGFDLTEPAPCEGEDCLGRPSSSPGLAAAGSGGSGGQGGTRPRFTLRAPTIAQRRALALTGRLSLAVRANVPGTVSARARARIAGKRVDVASARRTVGSAGTVQLRLTLSRKARARIAVKRRLTIRVVVRHSGVAGARSMTLSVKGGRS